MKQKNR